MAPVPRTWLSNGRVIWIWTATQGKVHYAPHLFSFSGALPWKHQLKLKIWLSLRGVCNERQIEHCTHWCHGGKQQQSTADVRRLTCLGQRLDVNCCLCWSHDMCLVYLYITIPVNLIFFLLFCCNVVSMAHLWSILVTFFSPTASQNNNLTSRVSHPPLLK